ncbi:hypothetical protein O6H91_04G054200 [Diphasiastrum complanatum]|uniref:Uncharacterized protein n=1 Tax=Diphasiastrum complanatum TaxID=34168 RepID=A0ACC2DWZ8_DIPCM|nr:hypothetical protein O6H91_04G054200 [Diphasiastrum complanatum]
MHVHAFLCVLFLVGSCTNAKLIQKWASLCS